MCECGGAARNIGDFCVHYVKCLHVTAVAWYTKLKPWNEVESWELQIGNRWSIPTAQAIFDVSSLHFCCCQAACSYCDSPMSLSLHPCANKLSTGCACAGLSQGVVAAGAAEAQHFCRRATTQQEATGGGIGSSEELPGDGEGGGRNDRRPPGYHCRPPPPPPTPHVPMGTPPPSTPTPPHTHRHPHHHTHTHTFPCDQPALETPSHPPAHLIPNSTQDHVARIPLAREQSAPAPSVAALFT